MKTVLGLVFLVISSICSALELRQGSFRVDCEGLTFDPLHKYQCEASLAKGSPDILTISKNNAGDWEAKDSRFPAQISKGKTELIDGLFCVDFTDSSVPWAVCAAPINVPTFTTLKWLNFQTKTGLFVFAAGFACVDLIEVIKK